MLSTVSNQSYFNCQGASLQLLIHARGLDYRLLTLRYLLFLKPNPISSNKRIYKGKPSTI